MQRFLQVEMEMSRRNRVVLALAMLLTGICAADTIITRDGSSYSGTFLGAKSGTIGFTDTSGIGYTFPVGDVQSLVFTSANDTVTLRNGKVYSGKFSGAERGRPSAGSHSRTDSPVPFLETVASRPGANRTVLTWPGSSRAQTVRPVAGSHPTRSFSTKGAETFVIRTRPSVVRPSGFPGTDTGPPIGKPVPASHLKTS